MADIISTMVLHLPSYTNQEFTIVLLLMRHICEDVCRTPWWAYIKQRQTEKTIYIKFNNETNNETKTQT